MDVTIIDENTIIVSEQITSQTTYLKQDLLDQRNTLQTQIDNNPTRIAEIDILLAQFPN